VFKVTNFIYFHERLGALKCVLGRHLVTNFITTLQLRPQVFLEGFHHRLILLMRRQVHFYELYRVQQTES